MIRAKTVHAPNRAAIVIGVKIYMELYYKHAYIFLTKYLRIQSVKR
jgi:hypothetical protein